jgi:DnaJ-domain-containing protein 1
MAQPRFARRCHRGFASSASSSSSVGKQRTYYDVLEITRKAKQDDVKEAYRLLAKRFHPDMNIIILRRQRSVSKKFRRLMQRSATHGRELYTIRTCSLDLWLSRR